MKTLKEFLAEKETYLMNKDEYYDHLSNKQDIELPNAIKDIKKKGFIILSISDNKITFSPIGSTQVLYLILPTAKLISLLKQFSINKHNRDNIVGKKVLSTTELSRFVLNLPKGNHSKSKHMITRLLKYEKLIGIV